uniref:Uncharacterized protein n=1 Tax=Acrobeloides nanus TaxID=290746 RepID=A0A914EGM2_9BILA
MACLWKANIQINNSVNVVPWVFATRVFKSDGTVDLSGIRTLQNAQTAGRASGDDWFMYPIMYPNPNGDSYAQISNLSQAITDAGFGWPDFDDTLYIAIEPGFWSQNKTANQQFLIDLAASMLHFMNFIGVYTSNSYWDQIVGADFNASIFFNGNDLPFLWIILRGNHSVASQDNFFLGTNMP